MRNHFTLLLAVFAAVAQASQAPSEPTCTGDVCGPSCGSGNLKCALTDSCYDGKCCAVTTGPLCGGQCLGNTESCCADTVACALGQICDSGGKTCVTGNCENALKYKCGKSGDASSSVDTKFCSGVSAIDGCVGTTYTSDGAFCYAAKKDSGNVVQSGYNENCGGTPETYCITSSCGTEISGGNVNPPNPSPTPTPTPTPTPSTSDNPCFAAETVALRPDGTAVAMAELRAGDYVIDGPDSITRVVVNQHRALDLTSALLTISHSGGAISLTPDHVIEIDGKMAAAREAKVGSQLGASTVVRITESRGTVVNPVTSSGKIVAGGLAASSHPEWIAAWFAASWVPFPLSLFNLHSYLLPEAAQAYYDAVLEPAFRAATPYLVPLKDASPSPLVVLAIVIGDLVNAAGFIGYSLLSQPGLAVALGAVGLGAKVARKA